MAGCKQCGRADTTPSDHNTGDRITPKSDRPELELSPLPQPPQIDVAGGTLPGIPKGPLSVVVGRPTEQLRGNERPALTFNKPVVPLGAADKDMPEPATLTPFAAGAWRWIGSSAAEFMPAVPLPYATTFTVNVPATLAAIDGEKMAAPYSFSFRTLQPELTRTAPSPNWSWLDPSEPLVLTFNQPVKGLEKAKLTANGAPVTFSVGPAIDVEAEEAKKAGRRPEGRTPWGRPTRYELKLPAMPGGAAVRLDLDGVTGVEGPLGVEAATSRSWKVRGAMALQDIKLCGGYDDECPQGPVTLQTSNEVDVDSLKGRVHIQKKGGDKKDVAFDAENSWMRSDDDHYVVTLDASLQPGTEYVVTVDAGVADEKGGKAAAMTKTLKTGDIQPWLSISSPFVLLEKSGDGALPIESANLKEIEAQIRPLTVEEMARVLADERNINNVATAMIDVNVAPPPQKNVFSRTPLALRPHLPTGKPQLFWAAVRSDEHKRYGQYPMSVLGQITDLAAHAKLGATASLVWVTSLTSGQPVEGAAVKVYDDKGVVKAEAVTDKDGLAKFKGMVDVLGKDGDSDDSWHVPFALVAATKGDDTGVTLSQWEGESRYGVSRGWDGDIPDVDVVLFAERGIYRPGESVELKGVVRQRVRGALSVPKPDSELKLTVVDNGGKAIKEERVPLSKFGTFSSHVQLPKDAPLGWWQVRLAGKLKDQDIGGGTSFRVEQYRAPQFKVDVQGPMKDGAPAQLTSGDKLQATVSARYLFGAPMPGAEVETTITRETSEFYADGEDTFSFGINSWWWDDEDPRPSSDVYARAKGVVGADGTFVADAGDVVASAGRTWRYTVEAEVKDVSRQAVANRTTVVVHPAAVYAGVKVEGGFGEVGKEARVDIIATDVKGKRQAGVNVDVVVKRREWKNVKKKDKDLGRYVMRSEPVETEAKKCPGLKSTADVVKCSFTPDKPGLHIVEATAVDDKGRKQTTKTSFYVSGDGWVSWQRGDDDSLELVADKKLYAPGDTAKIIIKSPWPTAEAIVTTEREGVRTAKRYSLKGSATAVDVAIDEAAIPNVYVTAVLVRGRVADSAAGDVPAGEVDPGRPQVKVGTMNLSVEKTHKRLDVAIDAGAGTKRPGQKLQIKVNVTDWQKKGVPAEVTLWAVDEAVLRLTDYSPPDLLSAFTPERGLSVRFGEPLIHLVKKQAYGQKGDPGGGGGADSGSGFRSNFKTTALFVPDVVTDANGSAVVDVTLPDDLTTYRLMAVAVAEADRFGAGKGEMVVAKPIMALPALPRVVRVGDEFEAGVVVHAAEAGDVVVVADAKGVVIDGDKQKTLALNGKGLEARFKFHAEAPGTATFLFKAGRGTESDGVKISIPIYLPVVIETTAVSGSTDDKVTEALSPPGQSRPDIGGLEVTLGSTALAGYQEAMKQLVDYPHGCLEQQSSRLIPFLALRELQGGFGETHKAGSDAEIKQLTAWLGNSVLDKDGTPKPDLVIQKTIDSISALQDDGSGGFHYWPESSCVDPWASSYATLSLARAKELGYQVKPEVLKNALKFLEVSVLKDNLPSCGWKRYASTPERVLAGFVLARAGTPKTAMLSGIVDQVLKKPTDHAVFTRALLADALVVGKGSPETAQKVLQTVMNTARETPREVHFEEPDGAKYQAYWSSDVRTSAIVLMTLVDASPDHPFIPKLAQYLQTARLHDGKYRNTQEAAFALMAMSEVIRTKEKNAPRFDATVSLGGAPLITEDFQGRNLDVVTKMVSMQDVLAKGPGDQSFVFEKKGEGTLYYTALLRRAPSTMPTNALDKGFIVQRWFEPIGDPAKQGRSFYAGDLVRVRVRIATKDARRYVAVDVPLPSGLEAVDTSLASSASSGGRNDDEASEGGDEYDDEGNGEEEGEVYGFWSPFEHSEKRDDRVSYYADDLPPGVHTLTFVTRATTMGKFILAPAEASEMYAPEVFGRSDGGSFSVVAVP